MIEIDEEEERKQELEQDQDEIKMKCNTPDHRIIIKKNKALKINTNRKSSVLSTNSETANPSPLLPNYRKRLSSIISNDSQNSLSSLKANHKKKNSMQNLPEIKNPAN